MRLPQLLAQLNASYQLLCSDAWTSPSSLVFSSLFYVLVELQTTKQHGHDDSIKHIPHLLYTRRWGLLSAFTRRAGHINARWFRLLWVHKQSVSRGPHKRWVWEISLRLAILTHSQPSGWFCAGATVTRPVGTCGASLRSAFAVLLFCFALLSHE